MVDQRVVGWSLSARKSDRIIFNGVEFKSRVIVLANSSQKISGI